jgi:hypothetical protein
VHLTAQLHDLVDARGLSAAARYELEGELDAIPSALVDALAQQQGLFEAALGPRFRVRAGASGSLQAGRLELTVEGDRGTLAFAGELEDGVLAHPSGDALRVDLRPERALLDRYLGASLPEGLQVEPAGEARLELALSNLRLDVQRLLDGVNAQQDALASVLAACEVELRAETNAWRVAGDGVPIEGGVALEDPRFAARLAPAGEARKLDASLSSALGGGLAGRLEASAACDDLAGLVAIGPGRLFESLRGDEPKLDASVALSDVPTAPLAPLAPGLDLAELIGGELDLRAELSTRGAARAATLALRAPYAELDGSLWLAGGVLVCPAARALELRLHPPAGALARALAPYVPEGATIELGEGLRASVGPSLELPLDAFAAGEVLLAVLRRVDAAVEATVDRLVYRDPKLAASQRELSLSGVSLAAHVSHEASPGQLGVTLRGRIDDPQGSEFRLHAGYPGMGALEELADLRDLPLARVELDLPRFPVALLDAWAAGDGALVADLGAAIGARLVFDVAQSTGSPVQADLAATLPFERGESKLTAKITVDDPFERRAARPAGALPEIEAELRLDGTRVLEGFLPPAFAPTVLELAGDSLQVEVANRPARGSAGLDDTRLEVQLDAARIDLAAKARIEKGTLRTGDEPFLVELRPTAAMIDRHVGSKLPQGATIAFAIPDPLVVLQARAVELPLGAWLPAEGTEPLELADALRRTSARIALDLPSLSTTQPALGDSGRGVPIAIERLGLEATLAAGKPATAEVRGAISGSKAGKIDLQATVADVGAFFDEREGAPAPSLALSGELTGVPSGLIDALSGQEGLLADVLGPEANLKVAGAWPSAAGEPMRIDLTSQKANVELAARFEEQVVVAQAQGEGLEATLPLTPLFSRRIVGNLVPLLVDARKPESAAPIGLSVRDFTLPLDKDLRKLDADVTLSLGEVVYELLPGLGDVLAAAGLQDPGAKQVLLPTLKIAIRKGVASYDRMPFTIAGREFAFAGKFDLVKKELDLTTEVPLSLLGSKVSGELEKVRAHLDPETRVPIEIKGVWPKPKVRLGDDFVEKVLKKAAEDALKKGLLDLLGKKKKDK